MNQHKGKICLGVLGVGAVVGYYLGGFFPTELKRVSDQSEISAAAAEVVVERDKVLPLNNQDYSFGYWQNGMRKNADDKSADVLNIETGYFGLAIDMAKLDQAKFGTFSDSLDYAGALASDGKRMEALDSAELSIELEKNGKVFRAVSCRSAEERASGSRFHSTRLWESARYVQFFDIQKLVFQDSSGEKLVTDATLNIQAWPGSLALTAEVAPAVDFKTGPEFGVQGNGYCVIEKPLVIEHDAAMEHENFTVETWIKIPEKNFHKNRGWVLSKNKHEGFDGNFGFSVAGMQASATMNIGGGTNRFYLRSGGHALLPDKWHHLAMSYDGKMMSFYVDGRLRDSKEVNKKRTPGNGDMRIGQRADGNGGMAEVIVDQIRVWDRALPANELTQHVRKPAEIKNRGGLTYENNFEDGSVIPRQVWQGVKMSVRLKNDKHDYSAEQLVAEKWNVGETKKLTVKCELTDESRDGVKIAATMRLNELPPVTYRDDFGCYVALVKNPKRDWASGYTKIDKYDEIDITIESDGEKTVPFMMEMFNPANVTGVSPMLCDENGVPTGIPVQLSKNWHEQTMGTYMRAYTMLPAVKGQKKYKLRLAYGFYGSLPAASHAQLSLVGYGGNGRWDQLAIGCWGETYCMDMDMSCVDVTVTDVRMLMARRGLKGKSWGWTDAGWGGDWLNLKDAKGQKHLFNGLKTAYMAHGPCLTEVKYDGFYGSQREVDLTSTVRTLRTDDHARTFTTMKYSFDKKVNAAGCLFKMGRTGGYATPKIAYGNRDGLIKEYQVPNGLKMGEDFVKPTTLTGAGPWWVAFPGAHHDNDRDWGTGYRAMVIRSFKANVAGKEYTNPTVSFPIYRNSKDGESNLDFLLNAPAGVAEFNPGDSVEFDVEWITLPRVADDYYGPNETFRKHVAENPSSWMTTYREAIENDLKVSVDGGTLQHNYPIIIQADKQQVTVEIEGGVGYVPIRFEGIHQAKGYALYQVVDGKQVMLDQAVHGNDFWQTDYDAMTNSFKLSFNLPLDGKKTSTWILRKVTDAGEAPAELVTK